MITNWYSTNIDLQRLSRRLRMAYALWVGEGGPDDLPSLERVQNADRYAELSPYILLLENRGEADSPDLILLTAGAKVVEIFGRELAKQRVGDVFQDAGQTLIAEVFHELRNERKPVHCGVTGSPVVSKDIEVIVMPLRHEEATKELALAIYDF